MEHLKRWVSRLPEKRKIKSAFEAKLTVGSPSSPRLWVKGVANSPQPTWWRRIDLALVMSSVAEKREFQDFWKEKITSLQWTQNQPINWVICSVQKMIRETGILWKFDENSFFYFVLYRVEKVASRPHSSLQNICKTDVDLHFERSQSRWIFGNSKLREISLPSLGYCHTSECSCSI